jgi:hypothetical protein
LSHSIVQIIRCIDDSVIAAQLLDGIRPEDMLIVEGAWSSERSIVMQELLTKRVPRDNWPQSLHWCWREKARKLRLLETNGYGISCEQQWQGVMLTKTASAVSRLGSDRGKPLVYIDYIEVAPWNWAIPEIGRMRQFRGIGSVLFWRAVKQSQDEGFHGRVGLHSLPQAESFYQRFGMTCIGPDASKQNLLYYELSRQEAQRHLTEGGIL